MGLVPLVRLRTVYRGLMLFGQVKDCPSVPWSGSSGASYPWQGSASGVPTEHSVQNQCSLGVT